MVIINVVGAMAQGPDDASWSGMMNDIISFVILVIVFFLGRWSTLWASTTTTSSSTTSTSSSSTDGVVLSQIEGLSTTGPSTVPLLHEHNEHTEGGNDNQSRTESEHSLEWEASSASTQGPELVNGMEEVVVFSTRGRAFHRCSCGMVVRAQRTAPQRLRRFQRRAAVE